MILASDWQTETTPLTPCLSPPPLRRAQWRTPCWWMKVPMMRSVQLCEGIDLKCCSCWLSLCPHACSCRVGPCAPCGAASPTSSPAWATRYPAATPATPATVASSMLSATVAELDTTAQPDAPEPQTTRRTTGGHQEDTARTPGGHREDMHLQTGMFFPFV